jgi:tetratricopeptide (TPR) repeat protein
MKQSLEAHPRQFEMALLLGKTQLQSGQTEEALQTLLPWSRTWPEDVELNYTIGQALQQQGDDQQADGYLARTAEGRERLKMLDGMIQQAQQRPQEAAPRQQVGRLLMRLKNREEGSSGWSRRCSEILTQSWFTKNWPTTTSRLAMRHESVFIAGGSTKSRIRPKNLDISLSEPLQWREFGLGD